MNANFIKTYSVSTYDELIHIISQIKKKLFSSYDLHKFSPIWYRGHQYEYYDLLPSIFRGQKRLMDTKDHYSIEHMLEDYRYQIFKSRAYDHLEHSLDSRIEWQEVMQHHFTKTRLMDWSEGIISPLIFALEPFITPKNDRTNVNARKTLSPCIWIMSPYMLNKTVYDVLISQINGHYYYIENALSDLVDCGCPGSCRNNCKKVKYANKIGDELSNKKDTYFSELLNADYGKRQTTVSGITSLSVIQEYRQKNCNRLLNMLLKFEFNPYFYLLARYYVDGVCAPLHYTNQLPPLATIHPYHSNRIKAQAGAFSVFPYYGFETRKGSVKKGNNFVNEKQYAEEKFFNNDLRNMNNQNLIKSNLIKIRLTNPSKIAEDLLIMGKRRSSVYPELQNYSDDIEAEKYYI